MNYVCKQVVVALAFLLVLPLSVSAETVLRTGESVSITNDSGVVGDFYGAGNVVTVSGLIEGDFVSLSGRTTHNGQVSGDLLAAGATVDIHGAVGDDVRIVAGEAVIADVISGDLVVLAGTVKILSTATIEGDVFIYAQDAEIAGPVGGTVFGNIRNIRIDSPVGGDVSVHTGQLVLGENADVSGSVTYTSAHLLERSPNAVVSGEVLRNDSASADPEESPLQNYIYVALMLIFAALIWYLLSRQTLHSVVQTALEYSPRPILYGLTALIGLPVLAMVLITSMLGIAVGTFIVIIYIGLLLLSVIATAATLGVGAFKILNQPTKNLTVMPLLFGCIIAVALPIIPIVGPLVLVCVFLVTFGAVVERLVTLLRK